jgi:predicted metal-binding protein
MLDPIILGHNPFFGVDHRSQERGNEKAARFEDPQRIIDMFHCCHDQGVRGVMMSTHVRAGAVCTAMARAATTLATWRVYPLVPYMQKYIRGSNEKGLVNVVLDTLAQASLGQKFRLLVQGGRGLLGKDLQRMLSLLIDMELVPFSRRPLGAVFLHDALTDLALGLGLPTLLRLFQEHVTRHYGVPAGLVTKNLPLLRQHLTALGWTDPLVMVSVNALGFAMNPSRDGCAEVLQSPGLTCVAMNTLASGHLPPPDAYRYLAQFPAIRSVVVGMSRPEHAVETIAAIRCHLPWAQHEG